MRVRAALLLAAFAATTLLLSAPADAAASVGHVAVSNPTPSRASTIAVVSSGWRPGRVVSISLAGTVLARATADQSGVVHTDISIPASAPRFASLAVIGSAASGVPQQIVTNLTVVGTERAPAPERPWTAICLVLAIATALLLVSVRSERVGSGPIAAAG